MNTEEDDDDGPTPPADQFLGGHAICVVLGGGVILSASLHDIRLRNTLLGLPGDEADRTFVFLDPPTEAQREKFSPGTR